MAKKISEEVIQKIKSFYVEEKISTKEIAERLNIGVSTVNRYLKQSNLLEKRPKQFYSSDILKEIKRLYEEENMGSTSIGRKLGISEKTIVNQLIKMKVKIRGPKRTYDYEKIINMYTQEQIPIHLIAKQLNSSEETISKILRQNNIEIYGHGIPKFNYHIFDSIDTEEKAYWLGFIFADGYIATINPSKPNYAFELSLKSEDFEHLNKFNAFTEFIGNNVKVNRGNIYYSTTFKEGVTSLERCRWQVSNKHLWETLNSYGCTPRKSSTLKFPDKSIFKDESLIRHFIRGYFDGDGCISFFDKEHTIPTFSIASKSKESIEPMLAYLPGNLKLHFTNNMYVINTCGNKAMQCLHYLFDNSSIYLDRKYNLFTNFCRLYEESYRELQTKIGESCDANPEVTIETKESIAP